MQFDFGQRSLYFGAYIFGDVIDGSSAKTTGYDSNLPEAGQELLALQVSICAHTRTVRASRVRA